MKFLDGAIILSSLTALLYCASNAYTHGYFGTLELDPDVLDRDLHGILYHGMILCLYPIIVGPILLFFLSLIRSLIILEISRVVRSSFGKARKISKFVYFFSLRPKKKRNILQQRHFNRNFSLFSVAVFIISFACFMAYLENKGKTKANILITDIESGKFTQVASKNAGINGMAYLYCGARNCAALNPVDKKIYYFVQDGHVIARPNIKAN